MDGCCRSGDWYECCDVAMLRCVCATVLTVVPCRLVGCRGSVVRHLKWSRCVAYIFIYRGLEYVECGGGDMIYVCTHVSTRETKKRDKRGNGTSLIINNQPF